MYNTSNPAELYPNTTWELLPDNKFLKTGSSPLQQAGNNSIKLTKANLPAEKLQVESFNMTRGTMDITGINNPYGIEQHSALGLINGAFGTNPNITRKYAASHTENALKPVVDFKASRSWTGSTSSASPYTTAMGSGTPISISPEHITVKAWKRLS